MSLAVASPIAQNMSAPDASRHAFEMLEVVHRYGDVLALDNISLWAAPGEFLTLLGHSGSGKTSLLKILAGLETPTSVRALTIGLEDVRAVPAYRRNTTTVFQHYALFPHMTVLENVEYGLRTRGVSSSERRRRAEEMLSMVRLSGLRSRRVNQLSGGEAQRIALARALITSPAVLLLDEPLGALDERLRIDMQLEILQLQRELGTTFLYVTHSQEEALTMSDRIVLLNRGRIMQEGTPQALFDRPANRFTAEFMGIENILQGDVVESAGSSATLRAGQFLLKGNWTDAAALKAGAAGCATVRAERLRLTRTPPSDGMNVVPCSAEQSVYKGKYFDQIVTTPAGRLKVRIWDSSQLEPDPLFVSWRPEDCAIVLDERADSNPSTPTSN